MNNPMLDALLTMERLNKSQPAVPSNVSRKERIAMFNKKAEKIAALAGGKTNTNFRSTFDFVKKTPTQSQKEADGLHPISLSALEVSKTHRGRVVYCRIATKVMVMNSAMCLVEEDDQQNLVALAVYNLEDNDLLRERRRIAILEPFFKIRSDGTCGLRVDNPSDLVLDVVLPKEEKAAPSAAVPLVPDRYITPELRLESIVASNPEIGVNKLHGQLQEEGYNITKKQVRALKIALKKRSSEIGSAEYSENGEEEKSGLIPILSERRPEKHKVLNSKEILNLKQEGNAAFLNRKFSSAEHLFTEAIERAEQGYGEPDSGGHQEYEESTGVSLWQLYSNRCAAKLANGKLEQAMEDALSSNRCAPTGETKPILRCSEVLARMGKTAAADQLLHATASLPEFADNTVIFETKKDNLRPKITLRVGKGQRFETIALALAFAPAGSEIIVDKGVYTEPLVFTKPVTLRCDLAAEGDEDELAAIRSLENSRFMGAEIRVQNANAVRCSCLKKVVCLIGFRITCIGSPFMNFHALFLSNGIMVVRNCVATAPGPVALVQGRGSRMVVESSAFTEGSQGGILVCDDAHIHLQQVHCCRNAAMGLEARVGGTVSIEGGQFYRNGRQGIMIWQSAGRLVANSCAVHSNQHESGILVSEGEAEFRGCHVYGNKHDGIVAQQKGSVWVSKCKVHDNCEGILIQDTGSARVEDSEVYNNRANGIFIGYDLRGSATVHGNVVHNNVFRGILVGAKRSNVIVKNNTEYGNKGLPPIFGPGVDFGTMAGTHRKYSKRLAKNKFAIDDAAQSDVFVAVAKQHLAQDTMGDYFRLCQFCKKAPGDFGRTEFSKCARCKSVAYCSKECQQKHWKEHKRHCRPPSVKYPSFLDPKTSV